MPRMHVVFGNYQGPIDAGPARRSSSSATARSGGPDGRQAGADPRTSTRTAARTIRITANHDDIFAKIATTTAKPRRARNDSHIRLEGCPVSVAEQVLALVAVGGLKNPYTDPRQVSTFARGYLGWRSRVFLNRLQNKRYQAHGSYAGRGQAAPEMARTTGK
jgi:hypothetical protein